MINTQSRPEPLTTTHKGNQRGIRKDYLYFASQTIEGLKKLIVLEITIH